jgi:hypothetical protein
VKSHFAQIEGLPLRSNIKATQKDFEVNFYLLSTRDVASLRSIEQAAAVVKAYSPSQNTSY